MFKNKITKEVIKETLLINVKMNLIFFPLHLYTIVFIFASAGEINLRSILTIYLPLMLASIGSYLFVKENKKNKLSATVYFCVQILIIIFYLLYVSAKGAAFAVGWPD